jgi:HSP20 family protein
MTLVKRNGNMNSLFPTFFDDLFNRDLFNWGNLNFSATNSTLPAVNIKETGEAYEVEVAAPGMTKQDFRIELNGNTLSISSEKTVQPETETDRDDQHYFRREFSYQSFQRTFQLQKDVLDVDKIQAKYENGLLHLVIPKKEEVRQKAARLIQVS